MRIDVALLPGQQFDPTRSVCIVVDVLRASSSIVTLLASGCSEIVPASNTSEARRLHRSLPGHLLCGEESGLPPPGFDYGNSPAEFSRLNLAGSSAILATSNGTRVLAAVASRSPAVLVGCLINRTAAALTAAEIAAREGLDIAVICSAAHGGSKFLLEDALGAGAIVDAAASRGDGLVLGDAARFAREAFVSASADIAAAVRSAYHSQELIDAGLGDDIEYCARLDVSSITPLAQQPVDGVLRLRLVSC